MVALPSQTTSEPAPRALPVEPRAYVMGALLVLVTRYPSRAQHRLDARTCLWAYGVERKKDESNRAARHLRVVAEDPACIPGFRIERDTTTSKFRFVITREGAQIASAAQ